MLLIGTSIKFFHTIQCEIRNVRSGIEGGKISNSGYIADNKNLKKSSGTPNLFFDSRKNEETYGKLKNNIDYFIRDVITSEEFRK